MDKVLPVIEFEGKQVKPGKNGAYKCPFNCGDPRYSTPSWKTEKGFRSHMAVCGKRPSLLQRQKENEELERSHFDTIKNEVLASLEYEKGQTIAVVKEVIVKPTHEYRGTRLVHVRYEAAKRFDALEIEIKSFDFFPNSYCKTAQQVKENCLLINNEYRLSAICQSLTHAKQKADQMKKSYDEQCQFASNCR